MKANVPCEPRQAQEACHEDTEQDDDATADDGRLIAIGEKELADGSGAGAERHEDRREAKNEIDPEQKNGPSPGR
jgi:hypothetical protein